MTQGDELRNPARLRAWSRRQNLPPARRDLIADPGHPLPSLMRNPDRRFIEPRSAM